MRGPGSSVPTRFIKRVHKALMSLYVCVPSLYPQVFNQRLRDEFGTAVLITSPTVPYKVR